MQLRLIALFVALTAGPALAQLPAVRLSAVFPPGGKSGSSVDVSISGIDLDGVSKLQFSHPGITASQSGDSEKFSIKIGSDVAPGNYDCRVIGKYGISNPRVFVVGDRDEAEAKPGASAPNAGKLPLDKIVNARTTSNVIDFWSFEASKGQRVVIECDARQIDSRLSPSMKVLDATGRELARSRRTGLLDFTAPDSATYTLRVADMLYRGGPEYFYRLCISTGPHIDSIFPPGGKAGSKGTYTLLGRNLPGGKPSGLQASDGSPLDSLDVEIELPKTAPAAQGLETSGLVGPSGVGLDGIAYRLKSNKGSSNPVAIVFTDADVVREVENGADDENGSPENAQKLTLPTTVAGRFDRHNDRDWYTFEAKKGDTFYIEAIGDRIEQPMAVALGVYSADPAAKDNKAIVESPDDETNLGTSAFRTATRDPVLKWDVNKDGVYRICVRDKFGTSTDDANRRYLLSIRKPTPDFTVVATPMSGAGADAALWSPLVRKGGWAPLKINVLRQDGYDGEVTVEVKDLPTGVTCSPVTVAAKESSGLLVFKAAADVKNWGGTLKLTAKGKLDDQEVSRAVRCGTVVWGDPSDGKNNNKQGVDPVVSRISHGMALGVCADETDPIQIAPAEEKVYEVQQGSKISIPLTVKKSPDIKDLKQARKLKLVGVDSIKGGRDVTVEASADKATLELDLNQTRLSPGKYTLCLASPAQFKLMRPTDSSSTDDKGKGNNKKKNDGKDTSITVYSAPITITVTPKPEKEKKKG